MNSEAPGAPTPQRAFKQALGDLLAAYVNLRLRGTLTREKRLAWVNYVNRRPQWLRAVDEHLLVPTDYGFSLYCDRRSGMGQTLMSEGRWEGLLSRTLLAALRSGDIAVDIGANIGYDTLLMSAAVGAGGQVFAFEPEPANLSLLLKNARAAKERNVVVLSVALSDAPAMAQINVTDAYYSGRPNLRPPAGGASSWPVLATRLDHVLDLPEPARIAFVKMDIEGYELRAIEGMGSMLDRIDCLSCEVNHAFLAQCGSSARDLFDLLHRHGFKGYCADPVSDGRWTPSGADFRISDAQGEHFDALFCRELPESLRPLIG